MISKLFAVYDSKAQFFGSPFTQQNEEVAKRAFAQAVNQPGTPLNDHPSDFSLVEIGTYDDATGVIEPINHINHGMAAQYKVGA